VSWLRYFTLFKGCEVKLKKAKFPSNRKFGKNSDIVAKPYKMLNNSSKTKNALKRLKNALKREKCKKMQKMLKNAIIIKIRALVISNVFSKPTMKTSHPLFLPYAFANGVSLMLTYYKPL